MKITEPTLIRWETHESEVPLSQYSDLTVECPLLDGPMILDFSDLTDDCTLTVQKVRRRPLRPASERTPAAGRRDGPIIVIRCPDSAAAKLHVHLLDVDVGAVTLRRAYPGALGASLGTVEVRNSRIAAFEAVGMQADDLLLAGVRCEGSIVLNEARIGGAVEIANSEVAAALKLPAQCEQLWLRRCSLGEIESSGMTVEGAFALEQVAVGGQRGINISGVTASDINVLDSTVEGPLSLVGFRARSASFEDSRIAGNVRLVLSNDGPPPHDIASIEPPAKTASSVVPISVSRAHFSGSFWLQTGSDARRRRGSGRQSQTAPAPRLALWGLSTEFLGPTHLELSAASGLPNARFHSGATIVMEGAPLRARPTDEEVPEAEPFQDSSVTRLDLHQVWSGGVLSIAGVTGGEAIDFVDDLVAPTLRITRIDLSTCRLGQLQVQALVLGSNVTFLRHRARTLRETTELLREATSDIPDRLLGVVPSHVRWLAATTRRFELRLAFLRALVLGVRALDDFLDAIVPTVWHALPKPRTVRAIWRALGDLQFRLPPPRHAFAVEIADEYMGHRQPLEFVPSEAIRYQGVAWQAPLRDRTPGRRPKHRERPRWQRRPEIVADVELAEELATTYRLLSTAFDAQGDASMAQDFQWQHRRWRRIYIARKEGLKRYDCLEVKLRPRPSLAVPHPVVSRAGRTRAVRALWPWLSGVTPSWTLLQFHQWFLGSGVRARTPLFYLAITFGLTFLFLSGRTTTCAPPPAAVTTTPQAAVAGKSCRLGVTRSIELTTSLLSPTVRVERSVLPSAKDRTVYVAAKIVAALLLAGFVFCLLGKLRRPQHRE